MFGSQFVLGHFVVVLSWHFCFYLFFCSLSLATYCLELGIPCGFQPYYFHLLLCTLGVLPCYYTLLFHLTISPCLLFHALILLDCYFFPFTPPKTICANLGMANFTFSFPSLVKFSPFILFF